MEIHRETEGENGNSWSSPWGSMRQGWDPGFCGIQGKSNLWKKRNSQIFNFGTNHIPNPTDIPTWIPSRGRKRWRWGGIEGFIPDPLDPGEKFPIFGWQSEFPHPCPVLFQLKLPGFPRFSHFSQVFPVPFIPWSPSMTLPIHHSHFSMENAEGYPGSPQHSGPDTDVGLPLIQPHIPKFPAAIPEGQGSAGSTNLDLVERQGLKFMEFWDG